MLQITKRARLFSAARHRCIRHKSSPTHITEDDGYGMNQKVSLWNSIASKFTDTREPGSLIIVRHGESEWNNRKLFTGWVDVDLSERGIREVEHAARLLLERGFKLDIAYTSTLKRCIRSAWILLNELNQIYRPTVKTWRLNERMYGALEGHSKPGLANLYGVEEVQKWRAGLSDRPPPMSPDHPYWHGNEIKYAGLNKSDIPVTESLQDTIDRTLPLLNSLILPDIKAGRNVLVVAHRNSIRGILKHIDNIGTEDIQKVSIPNGIPLIYKFDQNMKPIKTTKSVAPLSGMWLEKKGLLRKALEYEEELFKQVEGYNPPESVAQTQSKKYYTPHSLSASNTQQTQNANLKKPDSTLTVGATTREEAKNTQLVQSLTRLQDQRKLLDLVDDASKDSIEIIRSAQDNLRNYDDSHCPDIYIDPEVITDPELLKHQEFFNYDSRDFVGEIGWDMLYTHDVDIKRLNQVHYFAENDIIKEKGDKTASKTPPKFVSPIVRDQNAAHILDRPLTVIIRHGKTEHNKLGLFTGWEDASLATEGRNEAAAAGKLLYNHRVHFDVVYTSWLTRAIETGWLVLNELDALWIPVVKTWRLNERMYGALTGLSKKMIRQIFGEQQFVKWRRGFDTPPPPISSFSAAYPGNDERYVNYVQDIPYSLFETAIRSLAHGKLELHRAFPKSESLRDCMERTIPYYQNVIVPGSIEPGKNVLISSSENAIRGLFMELCNIPQTKIPSVEIPTGLPMVYDRKTRKIKLLDDGLFDTPPFERYNFGSAPDLLFDVKRVETPDGTKFEYNLDDILIKPRDL